jgi:L-ascorbate metabolism protein UlaG (beta-lactamase superfamily)
MRVTFVGHSTALLQTAGMNVLTDPVWSERASPVAWAGPRRHRPPGLRFEDLPPIDLVLISHNHYDHLDLPTLRRLAREHAPRFVAGLGVGRLLTDVGVGPVLEMDWWQQAAGPGDLTVSCVPARHFSGRGLRDRNASLWCGYVLHGPGGLVYFAGDTGFGGHFEEIARRLGAPRLALLPIGAYLPQWFMGPVHLSPPEALRAHRILGARTSVGLHFGTFRIADDADGQAVAVLRAEGGDQEAFWVLAGGEGRDAP